MVTLVCGQKFENRTEIGELFGCSHQYGITLSKKSNVILLFKNEDELYSDYFYPKGSYDFCMYTGIGRNGHQDSLENRSYDLNIAVLSHKKNDKRLFLFEKKSAKYYFVGEYKLIETHQNVQPDDKNFLRRVFVFHLQLISNTAKVALI